MDTTLLLTLGLIAAGIFLGLLIGRYSAGRGQSKLIREAFERGKAESEIEKANLAVEIGDQMLKLRNGIQDLARAYEGTARVVRERLLGSVERNIDGPSEPQLSLHFDSNGLDEKNLPEKPQDDLAGLGQGIDFEEITPEQMKALEIDTTGFEETDDEAEILDEGRRVKEKFVSNLI